LALGLACFSHTMKNTRYLQARMTIHAIPAQKPALTVSASANPEIAPPSILRSLLSLELESPRGVATLLGRDSYLIAAGACLGGWLQLLVAHEAPPRLQRDLLAVLRPAQVAEIGGVFRVLGCRVSVLRSKIALYMPIPAKFRASHEQRRLAVKVCCSSTRLFVPTLSLPRVINATPWADSPCVGTSPPSRL
jgi:hypothetical protein